MENDITIKLSREDVAILDELVNYSSYYALSPHLMQFLEGLYKQVPPFNYQSGYRSNVLTRRGWLPILPNGKYDNMPIRDDMQE